MAEFARMEARRAPDPDQHPSRLMRILLAVREVALILWLAVGTVLGVAVLVFLAAFGQALDDRATPDPTPLPGYTECVGEVC